MNFPRTSILMAAGLTLSAPAWAETDAVCAGAGFGIVISACDVGTQAIETHEIKDGAVTKQKLGNNSVDSSKIQNGSVKKEDLSPGVQWQMNANTVWNAKQEERIDDLEDTVGGHTQAINAHSALLSGHTAKLDEHGKGIAIAMALPDAWIESNKRFAIAGNIGGFGDETAIGAAVILRLDDVWSINGKLGADTGFEEFGWTAGARASW